MIVYIYIYWCRLDLTIHNVITMYRILDLDASYVNVKEHLFMH